jgi:FMN reductase
MTDPFSIAIITGSPSRPSRTAALGHLLQQRLSRGAYRVRTIEVRELPPAALLHAETDHPALVEAQEVVAQAEGVIVVSPVYKAAYTGVLKLFLDLLPQHGLRGKVVLPLLTGSSLAHLLALDYGLRPVLSSLDPRSIAPGLFLIDKWIELAADGQIKLDPEAAPRLDAATQAFIDSIHAFAQV